MITDELKDFANESNYHILKEDLIAMVSNAIEKENEIIEAFKSANFRNSLSNLIESRTTLRYPESMQLQNDIENYILYIIQD